VPEGRTLWCHELCQILRHAAFFAITSFDTLFFYSIAFIVQFLNPFVFFLILFVRAGKYISRQIIVAIYFC
jgi:hypothetical protein